MDLSPLYAVWPFASGWMLLWALAAAAPILIHLWNRRRYDEVTWAAMEYLLAAMKRNARRIRIEQLLLLLIRVAILICLAIALADPFWPFLRSLGGSLVSGGQTHWVLVIDGSYSMDYRTGDNSHFDRAKEQALRLVEEGKQGDAFTLVLMADPPRTIIADPAFDPGDVQEEIKTLALSHGGARLSATLAEVQDLVSRANEKHSRLSNYRVCIFTDLGAATWKETESASVEKQFATLTNKGSVLLFDLGEPSEENLAIESLEMSSPLASLSQEVGFSFKVRRYGDSSGEVQVKLLVDGRSIYQESVDLASDESKQIDVSHRFETAGEHRVEAVVDDPRLEVDNRRYLSVPVRESIRALCISSVDDTAQLVRLNLNPFQTERPYIQVDTAPETALLERNLNEYDCLFLCNIARFGRDEANVLHQYVAAGGGLVILLGDQTQPEAYNDILLNESHRLLAAQLGEVKGGEFLLTAQGKETPLVKPFVANPDSGLFQLPTYRYIQLKPIDDVPAQTELWFDSGDPALMQEKVGRGRVLLSATAASTNSIDRSESPPREWTLLPLWRNYPVFFRQLLHSAIAGRDGNRNVQIGDALEDSLYGVAAHVPLTLVSPGGRTERVQMTIAGEENRWRYDGDWQSGFYEARYGPPLSQARTYAVNVQGAESNLERIAATELPDGIQSELQAEDAEAANPPSSTQPELFRWVLGVLLLLLIAETYFARRFGGAR